MSIDIMQGEFEEAFVEFEFKRQEVLGRRFEETEAYLDFSARSEELRKELTKLLPVEHEGLVNKYTDEFMNMFGEYQMFFYKHGFVDCCKMRQIILGVGRSVNLNI